MKDRLSIHVENGQSRVFEAVTVLRNGGTASLSGLVGITNQTRADNESPIVPQTLFNIQGSGDPRARVSNLLPTGADNRTRVELCGNGNSPISGMIMSYNQDVTTGDAGSSVGYSYELGRGQTGLNEPEVSFIVHKNNMTAIGDIVSRSSGTAKVDLAPLDGNSALMISRSGTANCSGTLAIREQVSAPTSTSDFGKLYVKPYEFGGQTQAVYFSDDAGNEFNLVGSTLDSTEGHVFGDIYGNTFAGWYTPRARVSNASVLRNTYFGYGIDRTQGTENTIVGFQAGSGTTGNKNTVYGSNSFTQTGGDSNIIIGESNVTSSRPTAAATENINDCIVIGNEFFLDDFPEDNSLTIGSQGTPFITGLMKGANRKFSLIASAQEDTKFTIEKGNFDFNLGHEFENDRVQIVFGSEDKISSDQARATMAFKFSNSLGHQQTLVDFDPSGTIQSVANFATATFRRPRVSISGDLRVLGDIRFSDGTSLNSSLAFKNTYGLSNSGIIRTFLDDAYYMGLDFEGIPLAQSLESTINPTQTYVAVDLPNNQIGKMNLTSLGAYITSGTAVMSENCNAVFTNPDNVIQAAKNSSSVFIGCDVATGATGWKHGIFIGTNAGVDSTTPNSSLASDTACIYIGLTAGYKATNTNDAIFIGNSAGKDADNSNKSVFIGAGAGQNASNPRSIGIGEHALEGTAAGTEGGSRNIEIIAGLDTNQRLMYNSGVLSSRLNIQNTIAADTNKRTVSIGHATLKPEAVLEVIRDETSTFLHTGHTDDNIQRWINNDSGVARVNESGSFIRRGGEVNYTGEAGQTVDSWFGTHEGFMVEYLYAPSSYSSPTSGWMRTKSYETGFNNDRHILVVNRDPRLNIHGPGAVGGTAFVVTQMVNGEHRPIYVSCSGS